MEKLESLTGGITSSLASDKNATNCTVDIEVDFYRLQYSRSTTREGSALRNVQNSTPAESADRMNVQKSTLFETADRMNVQKSTPGDRMNVQQRILFGTTDWKRTPRSAVCPVRQNIPYIFKPQTHIAVSTKARNMCIF